MQSARPAGPGESLSAGSEERRELEVVELEVEVVVSRQGEVLGLEVQRQVDLQGEEQVPGEGREVEVDGRRLSITNLDKVLYPAVGFSKGQVLDYYARIAPVLLPHLSGRPVTLIRYPNGVEGKHFYEKRCRPHPDWVTRVLWRVSGGHDRFAWSRTSPPRLARTAGRARSIRRFPPAPSTDRPCSPSTSTRAPATIVECCRGR